MYLFQQSHETSKKKGKYSISKLCCAIFYLSFMKPQMLSLEDGEHLRGELW